MSVANQSVLEQKCALQSAQLKYLSEICQTLNSEDEITNALQKLLLVLPSEMNSSKTAVYVKESDDTIELVSHEGFDGELLINLEQFFNHKSILYEVINQRKVINIPSHEIPFEVNEMIATQAGITSGLLVPLLSSTDCMGVLFIGTNNHTYIDSELDNFIQTVGIQIGQSIALSTVYNKMKFSEMRYRTLLESASCSIFVINLQGTILETNQQGEKLLGSSRLEILGRRLKDYFTPEFKNQLAEWTRDLVINKYIEHTEIQIKRPNGEVRTLDGSGVLVEIDRDQLVFLVGTDMTEINQLRAQSLLQDKLATIGLLAAGVAHEINNPIACVLSNLDFMNEKLDELKNSSEVERKKQLENFKQVIKESIQAGTRVKYIVDDLNSYSRKDTFETEKIDIEETLESAINMAHSEYKNRATIERKYAENLPLLNINGGKLHQVFLNVIVNAAQSIEEGHPEKNKICITILQQDEKILIKIEDTGKGIPSEILPRIFDPFFTTKPIGEGTGLGLFICHEILKNLGGMIRAENKSDQGTVFYIELPITDKKHTPELNQNHAKSR